MENESLRIFLKLAISNIQLECAKVEINYPSAQYSDSEKEGMVTAYTEVSTALVGLLDEKPMRPLLIAQFDKWFNLLNSSEKRTDASFERGYQRALRSSIGDMEYLLDE